MKTDWKQEATFIDMMPWLKIYGYWFNQLNTILLFRGEIQPNIHTQVLYSFYLYLSISMLFYFLLLLHYYFYFKALVTLVT